MMWIKRFVLTCLLISLPSLALAAGTVIQALTTKCESGSTTNCVKVLTFTATAEAAAATYPATAMTPDIFNKLRGWYLYKVITAPGPVAPTADWDFTLKDGDGIDVLGGEGTDNSEAAGGMLAPKLTTGVYFAQPVIDPWTLAITNNSVNAAVIIIKAIFVR